MQELTKSKSSPSLEQLDPLFGFEWVLSQEENKKLSQWSKDAYAKAGSAAASSTASRAGRSNGDKKGSSSSSTDKKGSMFSFFG